MLHDTGDWPEASRDAERFVRQDEAWHDEWRSLLVEMDREPSGSGYVADSLVSARHALRIGTDYAGVVRAAIALGRDTDTTAAIAGGIAGLRYGHDAIPARWRDALRGRALLSPLLDRLLARVAR